VTTYGLRIGGVHWREMRSNHIASILAWLGAVYTTYLAIVRLQPAQEWYYLLGAAAALQYIMTAGERPIVGGKPEAFSIGVLIIDALVNAGGVFPLLRNIGQTPTAAMLAAGGIAPDVSESPAILASLVAGFIIALAPEALWRMK
jgi:hypothetical protein